MTESVILAEATAGPGPSSPPRSRAALWRRLRHDKAAAAGLAIITVMVLVAVFAPVLTALEGQDTTTMHPELVVYSIRSCEYSVLH